MADDAIKTPVTYDYKSMRTIRQSMKVIFSCLTAIPFFVFAFIFMNILYLHQYRRIFQHRHDRRSYCPCPGPDP